MRINYLATVYVFIALLTTVHAQTSQALLQPTKEINSIAYYELSQEADRLFQQRDFAKAAEAYAKLTNAYHFDAEKWYRLGRSLYETGRFNEAAQAFVKADELGVPSQARSNVAYAARAFAQSGDVDEALNWLKRAVYVHRFESSFRLLQEKIFDNLRENSRFQKFVAPKLPANISRIEGWRTDVDYLLLQIKLVNPYYSKQPLPAELVQAANHLKREIPNLSDAQVLLEIQHLLSLLKQAHNNLLPSAQDKFGKLMQLPLTFYIFPEGLYVVNALAPYEDLIGARVLRFDDTPAETAVAATAYVIPRENDMEIVWKAPDRLKILQWLHGLKVTKNPNRVNLTVINREGKTQTVSPEPVPLKERPKLEAPRLSNLSTTPPLYLSRPNDFFWFEYLEKDKTLYLQLNQIVNKEDESLAQFGLKVRDVLAKKQVHNLIVDVRRNHGGNTYQYTELLRTLISFDSIPDNRLFVLIGRWTFSATANLIADLDRLTNAVFVGEPSSGKPLTVGGDESPFMLPYSGVAGNLSSTSWALTGPRDTRLWLAPDLPVQLTARDYFANRDPIMEEVRALINMSAKR